jgi:glycine/D-amino acid oxidase-like deaminating enzyme
MSCAAMTGRTVAEIIAGERPQIDVAPFDPRRFA